MKHIEFFSDIKENLKNAPKEIKQSYNNLIQYFSVYDKSSVELRCLIILVRKAVNSVLSMRGSEMKFRYLSPEAQLLFGTEGKYLDFVSTARSFDDPNTIISEYNPKFLSDAMNLVDESSYDSYIIKSSASIFGVSLSDIIKVHKEYK